MGIGSNQGDRQKNIEQALEYLSTNGVFIDKISGYYEMEPWGYKHQPDFLNIAMTGYTDLNPEELHKLSKDIEIKIGRKDTFKWGPRIIDIDILLYSDMIIENEKLIIPHPLMDKRVFVLKPLSEIAPDMKHPIKQKTIKELLEELK